MKMKIGIGIGIWYMFVSLKELLKKMRVRENKGGRKEVGGIRIDFPISINHSTYQHPLIYEMKARTAERPLDHVTTILYSHEKQ